MASLGESLSVVIGANSDELVRELNKAASAVNKWGKDTQDALKKTSDIAQKFGELIGVSVAGGVVLFAKSLLESASGLAENADQLGINVEQYQALTFAAQQAGVQQDTFNVGLNRLSKNLGDANAGVQSAKDVFEKWGIQTKDAHGNALDLEAVIKEIADRMQSITDPTLRSAAAVDLLGKSGASLINFLSQGSAGLEEVTQKARDMGAVIGSDTVEAARKANDQLSALGTVIKSHLTVALVEILPTAEKLESILNAIGNLSFSKLSTGLSAVKAMLTGDAEGFSDVYAKFAGGQSDLSNVVAPAPTLPSLLNSGSNKGFSPTDPAAARAAAKASAEAQKAIDDYISKLHEENVELGTNAQQREVLKNLYAAETIARQHNVDLTEDQVEAIIDETKAIQDQKTADYIAKLQEENKQLSLNTEQREIRKNLIEAGLLAENQEIDLTDKNVQSIMAETTANEDLKKAIQDQKDKLAEAKQFASQFASSMTSAFEDAITSGKSLGDIFLSLIQDIEKMIIRSQLLLPLAKELFGANAIGGSSGGGGGLLGGLDFGKILGGLGGLFGGGAAEYSSAIGPTLSGAPMDAISLPGFASGGDPSPFMPSIVGEQGPEIFVPKVAGTIIPNNKLSGDKGVTVNQTLQFSLGVQQTVRAEVMRLMPQISDASKAAVADSYKRGGKFAKSLGG